MTKSTAFIGLSWYPFWHGTLEQLRANLDATAARYGKPIVVVETTYPWREYVTVVLIALAVAVLRLRPLRILASLALLLAAFLVFFACV